MIIVERVESRLIEIEETQQEMIIEILRTGCTDFGFLSLSVLDKLQDLVLLVSSPKLFSLYLNQNFFHKYLYNHLLFLSFAYSLSKFFC